FSSRRRHTRSKRDWSSDVCSSDLSPVGQAALLEGGAPPLGSSPLTVYGEHVAAIAPGATIILFTDGLVEVRGESLDAGLARLVRSEERRVGKERKGRETVG